jgi:hypothetical protein
MDKKISPAIGIVIAVVCIIVGYLFAAAKFPELDGLFLFHARNKELWQDTYKSNTTSRWNETFKTTFAQPSTTHVINGECEVPSSGRFLCNTSNERGLEQSSYCVSDRNMMYTCGVVDSQGPRARCHEIQNRQFLCTEMEFNNKFTYTYGHHTNASGASYAPFGGFSYEVRSGRGWRTLCLMESGMSVCDLYKDKAFARRQICSFNKDGVPACY